LAFGSGNGEPIVKRKPVADNWPKFDTQLLRDIAAAFKRRRRAIAYQVGLSCEREISESAAGAMERLNVEAGDMRLSAWSDGVLWLGVCVPAFGRGAKWAFKDAFHGDTQDVSAEALVGMVEATLALPFGNDPPKEREQLREVWARVGPYAG
jgi:hypothetical protein